MDLNTILCVSRSDMYGIPRSEPKQQFLPVVSSFKMDTLRHSVRKDKPDSRSSSRRSSTSPGSPSKSILRGQINGSPKQGSPQSNRNVRFTDGRPSRDSSSEYSMIHVNETTQTNGYLSPTSDEDSVHIYSKHADDARDRKYMDLGRPTVNGHDMKSCPKSSSRPRRSGDRSPIRVTLHGHPGFSEPLAAKQQQQPRELPMTPEPRGIYNLLHPQERQMTRQQPPCPMAVRKECPKRNPSPVRQSRPITSGTQTTSVPTIPSGQKIIQNMDFSVNQHSSPRQSPRVPRLELPDGSKIIQNMGLSKHPIEKSIAVQIQKQYIENKQVDSLQSGKDVECQTPRDIGVQTPGQDVLQYESESDTSVTGDSSNVSHAYAQTMSDDEEEAVRNAEVQTPRDVGVQTPRSVSIQTSDASEEEDNTATVAVQTPHDASRILQNMDIHTNIWSNTKRTDHVPVDEEIVSKQQSSLQFTRDDGLLKPSLHDLLTELSESEDEDEVDLPQSLTKPFPERESVYDYDQLKTSANGLQHDTCEPGMLIEHSAKQLLERKHDAFPQARAISPKIKSKPGLRGTGMVPNGTRLSTRPATSKDQIKQQLNMSQHSTETYDAGTQFYGDYDLEVQAKKDRIRELASNLEFTTIESHSFEPGSTLERPSPNPAPVRAPLPSTYLDNRDSLARNSFIKDLDLGPIPRSGEKNRNDRWFDYSPPRLSDYASPRQTAYTPPRQSGYKPPRQHDYTQSKQSGFTPPRQIDYTPPRQRIVKSVDFERSRRDRYRDNVGPNYLFFKNTSSGSKYESFEPQPRQTARSPYRSRASPPRGSKSKSRSSSAPATSRQPFRPTSSHLTPALNHLRQQAIRKSVTDNQWPASKSGPRSYGDCDWSDMFISSTNPPKQLTIPLADSALPSCFPASPPSPDNGVYETVGNQPRYMTDLHSSANCRPESKRRARTPSPSFRLQDHSIEPRKSPDETQKSSLLVAYPGVQRSVASSTSSKPPLPRGRPSRRDAPSPSRPDSSPGRTGEPRDSNNVSTPEPRSRSRSADSSKPRSRDQGTGTESIEGTLSRGTTISRRGATDKNTNENENEDSFFGNDAIQKIIESANL